MAKLIPIPLPDPDDEHDEIDSGASPAENDDPPKMPGRLWRVKKAATHKRNLRGPSYNINTPTAQNIDRDIPAGDTDEEGTRSEWVRTEHTLEAKRTKQRCQNASKNLTDPLPRLVATEQRLLEELRVREEATRVAEQARDQLLEQLRNFTIADATSRRHARVLRYHAEKASRVAVELKRREIADRYQLSLVAARINITPHLVGEEVDIVIEWFWAWFEEDCLEKSHLVGMWRDRDRTIDFGKEEFDEIFGAPKIPSENEIRERISVLRGASFGDQAASASGGEGE